MLKQIIVFCISTNLCAADIKNPEQSATHISSKQAIGLGLAALVVYTVMPNVFGDLNTSRLTRLAGAAVGAYGAYTIGGIINESINPSEDKKASSIEALQNYKMLTAKKEFRSCLMDNAYSTRNAAGIPTKCENLAHTYGITAGTCALDEITATFKETYRE